jgi:hypothetical protein
MNRTSGAATFPLAASSPASFLKRTAPAAILAISIGASIAQAQQSTPQETPRQELDRLTVAVAQAQAQIAASQQQLLELQRSLASLEQRFAGEAGQPASPAEQSLSAASPSSASAAAPVPASAEDIQERQAMQESQIATLDQSKVESESKYPVKVTGLILFNGFVNTSQVDIASAPATAVAGAGSTGASLRQTVLGIGAHGPDLFGAASHADLRVDFFGSAAAGSTTQTAYGNVGGLLRLRTAHATLDWSNTQAFVEMDRPILSPDVPTSLVAVGEPALAWSGNLWSWMPQAGATHTLEIGASHLAIAAALMDVPDPPSSPGATTGAVSQAEHSRWPGTELHFALSTKDDGSAIGVGGYFSPHKTPGGADYQSWAGTLDVRLRLPYGLGFTGSFYRGLALGGLGGGAYKDYIFADGAVRGLDDVGGWAQLKKTAGPHLEFNAAFGADNIFAGEFREYAAASTGAYQNLARNSTFFANTIYSPSAYLLFSLEYRHIVSVPVTGTAANSDVIGLGAGYRF